MAWLKRNLHRRYHRNRIVPGLRLGASVRHSTVSLRSTIFFAFSSLAFLRGNLAIVFVETGFEDAPTREPLLIPAEPLEHYELDFKRQNQKLRL
jgi:hypothetical protein